MSLKERYESILISMMSDRSLNGRHYLSYQRNDCSIVDVISSPIKTNDGLASFLKYEFKKAGSSIKKYICEKIDMYNLPLVNKKVIYSN